MRFLYFILIGLMAGWLAGRVMKTRRRGWVGTLIVGAIGAFLGGFIFQLLGFQANNLLAELITATLGAIVFLYLLQFVK